MYLKITPPLVGYNGDWEINGFTKNLMIWVWKWWTFHLFYAIWIWNIFDQPGVLGLSQTNPYGCWGSMSIQSSFNGSKTIISPSPRCLSYALKIARIICHDSTPRISPGQLRARGRFVPCLSHQKLLGKFRWNLCSALENIGKPWWFVCRCCPSIQWTMWETRGSSLAPHFISQYGQALLLHCHPPKTAIAIGKNMVDHEIWESPILRNDCTRSLTNQSIKFSLLWNDLTEAESSLLNNLVQRYNLMCLGVRALVGQKVCTARSSLKLWELLTPTDVLAASCTFSRKPDEGFRETLNLQIMMIG